MEFRETDTGTSWRYSHARPLVPVDVSASDRVKSFKAYKIISGLWLNHLGGVRVQCPSLGAANLRDQWVRVSINDDSFLLEEKFWNAKGSWKDFVRVKI